MAKRKARKRNKSERPEPPPAVPEAEVNVGWFGGLLGLFRRRPPTTIRYRILDWNKVKTTKDLVSVLRGINNFRDLKVWEPLWGDLGHLAGDEVHEESLGGRIF